MCLFWVYGTMLHRIVAVATPFLRRHMSGHVNRVLTEIMCTNMLTDISVVHEMESYFRNKHRHSIAYARSLRDHSRDAVRRSQTAFAATPTRCHPFTFTPHRTESASNS